MAGFFPLTGGRSGSNYKPEEQVINTSPSHQIAPENWFLYRNEDSSCKGLETWLHHHHQFQHLYASGGGVNAATINEPSRSAFETRMISEGGGGVSCRDCGNKAKKDCSYQMCRTCCKSRGFQCQTHIKSTWVPASHKRERQRRLADLQQQQLHAEIPKRRRENPNHMSGLEEGNFPPEVNSTAVFRCVRLSSTDERDDEYAYQTAVNIGGRVFKGILYDQGPEPPHDMATETSSAAGGAGEEVLPLTAASASATAAFLDPSVYPAALSAFMAGTQFFPHTRS